jgi:hypothetical protein
MPPSSKEDPSGNPSLKNSWLGRFLEEEVAPPLKANPLFPTATFSLQELTPHDAVDIVDKKIRRAQISGIERVRILFSPEAAKVKKALLSYLGQSATVKSFECDAERDDQIWVTLTHRT